MPKITPKSLSVKKLVGTYEGLRDGPLATLELLAFHLREGNIRARAWQVQTSDEPNLSKAWKLFPREKSRQGGIQPENDVKRSVWRKSVDWDRDFICWHINRDQFVITIRADPIRRILIRGLRVHSGDARKLFDKPKLRKSRYNKHDGSRHFWYEIIRLILNGRKDLGKLSDIDYASDIKLAAKVTETFSIRALADDIEGRIPFTLDDNQIFEEVSALRTEFGLTGGRSTLNAEAEESEAMGLPGPISSGKI